MNRQILVVDDDEVLRIWLQRYLTGKGNTVVATGDGREALALVEKNRFELVLLDIQLGDKSDGVTIGQMLAILRPDLIIFLMSGDPSSIVRARNAGFKNVFPKPISASELDHL